MKPEIVQRFASPSQSVPIPASVVEKANLSENCKFDVDYMNGVIIFTPKNSIAKKDDVLSYAGLFSGAWGKSTNEVETTIITLHNEWKK